ncbi:polysaccharide deacetylase family protein [Microbacterium sp. Clip185]|uniref:polysaccharide deacetylase family protein n=1 Tax=Microbacterium sp. Clip185 TaxID=3025663 RepID=UPI0023671289|nr:polysaccharide deacetylase family protein [Microbacterium sp. Clip185]WDG17888.1 polysaccharide deacetylase family protein [Microbacterium sp. Clip185]
MHTTRRQQRGRRSVLRRRRALAAIVAALAVVLIVVGVVAVVRGMTSAPSPAAQADPGESTSTPTPTPTPLTASQQLLADSDDPAACAVSFAGDGIAEPPQLQSEGKLYAYLPIPSREGAVFAGWYATAADAQALTIPARVNGADIVTCTDKEITLYGAWKTPEEVASENVGVPILMYHQFTTRPEGEDGWLKGNYAYINDFDAHMAYIAEKQFYLPTWDELSAFIDGRLFLPHQSVIVTDDDADQTWLDLAVPVVEKYQVLTTSFVITGARQAPSPGLHVLQRSHTHDMHTAGDNGKGRMVNYSVDQIVADMNTSAQILGAKEVMAYPYGHYNDTAKEGLRQAGYEMARTIEPGYVRAGTDKLALPTVRINYGMGLQDLINLIG